MNLNFFIETIIERKVTGAVLTVDVFCPSCQYKYSRSTSEKKNRQYILNYLLSCSILFSGGIAAKFFR